MRFTLKTDDIAKGLGEAEGDAARSVTSAMREVTDGLKTELRADVTDAGLGQRLANTWRGKTYPEGGISLEAASFVWSKAPNIVDAFDRGVTIKSNRGLWLAIPTPVAGSEIRCGMSHARSALIWRSMTQARTKACGCPSRSFSSRLAGASFVNSTTALGFAKRVLPCSISRSRMASSVIRLTSITIPDYDCFCSRYR